MQKYFITIALCFLVGCGFKLRGLNTLNTDGSPLRIILVSEHINGQFRQSILQQFAVNGIQVVNPSDITPSENETINRLVISPIEVKSTQVAVSNISLTKAYERHYIMPVALLDSKESQLRQQTLSTSELVELNESRILAGEESIQIANNIAGKQLIQKLLFFVHQNK